MPEDVKPRRRYESPRRRAQAAETRRQILAAARNRVNVRYVPLRWTAVGIVLRLVPSFVFRKSSI